MDWWKTLICLASCLWCTGPAGALKCYQCSSSVNVHCTENMKVDDTNIPLEDCSDIHDASYCVKTTGIYKGEVGTARFCSSQNLGFICDKQKRMGDVREYRGCVYTCSGDGCNSTPRSTQASTVNIILLIIIISATRGAIYRIV